ncbi:MAG TPA: hypothetical protein VFV37_01710 [Luteibaculaceae bacterium]|nr:hypothetical protein [Luteibaculaceae bacterium]
MRKKVAKLIFSRNLSPDLYTPRVFFLLSLFTLALTANCKSQAYQLGKTRCEDIKPNNPQNSSYGSNTFSFQSAPSSKSAGENVYYSWTEYNGNTDMYQVSLYSIKVDIDAISPEYIGNTLNEVRNHPERFGKVECAEMYDWDEPGWQTFFQPNKFYYTTVQCDWIGLLVCQVIPFRRAAGNWKAQAPPILTYTVINPRAAITDVPVLTPKIFCGHGVHTITHTNPNPSLYTQEWGWTSQSTYFKLAEGDVFTHNYHNPDYDEYDVINHTGYSLTLNYKEGCSTLPKRHPLTITTMPCPINPNPDCLIETKPEFIGCNNRSACKGSTVTLGPPLSSFSPIIQTFLLRNDTKFSWSPSTGLDNPNSLNPKVKWQDLPVGDNQSVKYTLTISNTNVPPTLVELSPTYCDVILKCIKTCEITDTRTR